MKALAATDGNYATVQAQFLGNWKLPSKPTIVSIEQIHSPDLEEHFLKVDKKLSSRDKAASTRLLYHGTCEAKFETILQYGLQPPADYEINPSCKKCGYLANKSGSKTSTCLTDCERCAGKDAVRHVWNKCHMFGLGIYFADQSSKADRYVSDTKGNSDSKIRKLLVVKVCLGVTHQVDALKRQDEMHDLVVAPKGKDSIMAVGQGPNARAQYEVINHEYVIFNPKQTLPTYIVTYKLQ
jgi:hypothetical protein